MANRFYQFKLPSGPVHWEEIGKRVSITGIILEGESTPVVVLMPHTSLESKELGLTPVLYLSNEEWSRLIQCSDKPEVFEVDETGSLKAVMRKKRYEVSGAVQQKVWVRDGFKCMFCEGKMGDVQLTVDHFIPVSRGGANVPSNYLSACRKCNKQKGDQNPLDFCGLEVYNSLTDYLSQVGDKL